MKHLLFVIFVSFLGLGSVLCQEKKPEALTDFVRFVETEERGAVETAVVQFEHPDGTMVDLVGAIHIADGAYFEEINDRLADYDSVLFEMVGGENLVDGKMPQGNGEKSDDPTLEFLKFGQQMALVMLGMKYQLDEVDYSGEHFVHADLTMKELAELPGGLGKDIGKMLGKAMELNLSENMANGQGPAGAMEMDFGKLFGALQTGKTSDLRLLLAPQLDGAEEMLTKLGVEEGSIIITERNKAAMRVLESERAEGRKNIAIFYGAAHLRDFEKRLERLGFSKTKQEWIVAWDINKDKPAAAGKASPQKEGEPLPSEIEIELMD